MQRFSEPHAEQARPKGKFNRLAHRKIGRHGKCCDDLASAHAQGICVYGTHRQYQALMTCLVPSPLRDDHVHFVDGAAGGYASAAIKLKAQRETLDRAAAL